MASKTVAEIVMEYLAENGYDGLCGDDCGCEASDLFPCSSPADLCKAGFKTPCPQEECGEHDWHITPGEPRPRSQGGSAYAMAHALARERAIWCDKPEDRLYHAEDRTWWRRGTDNAPHRASPPPEVVMVAKALVRFTREGANDDEAYDAALRIIEQAERG